MIPDISSYSREFLCIPNFATALGHLLPYLTAEEAKQQALPFHPELLGASRLFQQRATSSKPNHVADDPAQQPSKKGSDKPGDQIQHALRCE